MCPGKVLGIGMYNTGKVTADIVIIIEKVILQGILMELLKLSGEKTHEFMERSSLKGRL